MEKIKNKKTKIILVKYLTILTKQIKVSKPFFNFFCFWFLSKIIFDAFSSEITLLDLFSFIQVT